MLGRNAPRRPCLSANPDSPATPTRAARSRWGAFSYIAFTVIWTASVVSNVGTAMFDTASGWLITSLNADPIAVSLVQVAVSLPLFLFTLPAGALADVIDSRRLLIIVEVAILAVSAVFALLVSLNLASSALLLATTFLLGVGGALTSPAWGSTIPLLVSKDDLDSAISANGVGFNLGRALGPALGGVAIAGIWNRVPFLGICGQQCRNYCGVALVAHTAKERGEPPGGAPRRRGSRRHSSFREQRAVPRDTDSRSRVLSFRMLIFGAAAARCAQSDVPGTGNSTGYSLAPSGSAPSEDRWR